MKTIKLKKVEEVVIHNNQEVRTEIKYSELLRVAINNPVQGGYTVSDMAQRIKLLDVVSKAADSNEVHFEDADYNVLKTLVKDTKWSIISKTIVDFVNEIDKQ